MSVMDIREMYQRMKPLIIRDIANGTSNKVTITGGGGGVSDHGLLSGLSDDDHTQYHTNARGDARYYLSSAIDSWRTTHLADTDAHHAMQHGIVDATHHTVTASQYDLIGATATNTLGVLTPASDASAGNTVLITDGSGNITINDLAVVDVNATGDITSSATTGRLYLESTAPQQWAFQASGLFMYVEPQTTNSSFKIRNVANSDILSVNTATGLVDVTSAVTIGTTLGVTGDTTLSTFTASGLATMQAAATVGTTLDVTGATTLSSTLDVTGVTTLTTDLIVDTDTLYVSDTHDQVWINSGTPDGSAALMVTSAATDDTTARIKKIASQSADLWDVQDESGTDLVRIDSSGDLESGNYVPLASGWHLSANGTSQLIDVEILGSLHASVFSADEMHSVDGELLITAGGTGKVFEAVTITHVEEDDDPKPTVVLKVEDPPVGPFADFDVGHVLRVKAIAKLPTTLGPAMPSYDPWQLWGADTSREIQLVDCWFTVNSYVRGGTDDHYAYTCTVEKAQACVLNPGTPIVSYGHYVSASEAPGFIQISARGSDSADPLTPIINIATLADDSPWNFDWTTHVRLGRLNNDSGTGNWVWGFEAGKDLSDSTQPYLQATSEGVDLYKTDIEFHDGSNTTGRMWSNGSFAFSTSVPANAAGSISSQIDGLQFDSDTGDFALGNYDPADSEAQYLFFDKSSGILTVSSGVTIPADNISIDWSSLSGRPDALVDLVQAPSVAGLHLTGNYLGYYDGSNWDTFIADTGYFYFGGTSGARLEWNGSKLSGYSSGNVEQWNASAVSGELRYAAESGALTADGLVIKEDPTSASDAAGISWWPDIDSRTGNPVHRITSYVDGTFDKLLIQSNAVNGNDASILIAAQDSVPSLEAYMLLQADDAGAAGASSILISCKGDITIDPDNKGTDKLIVDSDATFNGTITTNAGSAWDLQGYNAGSTTESGYLTVVVGGNTYRISCEAM